MARKIKRLDTPFVQGSDVTHRQVARDRNAATELRYGQEDQALGLRARQIPSWFEKYKQDVAARNQAFQAVNAQAVAQSQAATTQAAQGSQQLRTKMDAEAQADAQSRGATYSGRPGAEAAQGASVNQALGNLGADLLRAIGASYGGHAAGQSAVGSAAEVGENLRLSTDQQRLGREKGAFGQSYTAGRREDETRNVLERLLFTNKQDTLQANIEDDIRDSKDKASDRRLRRRNARDSIAAQREARAEKTREAEGKRVAKVREKSGEGVARIHDAISRWKTYARAVNTVEEDVYNPETGKVDIDPKTGLRKTVKKTIKPTPAQVRSQLVKDGFKGDELLIAVAVNAGRPLTAAERAAAKRLGIRIPREWLAGGAAKQHGGRTPGGGQ